MLVASLWWFAYKTGVQAKRIPARTPASMTSFEYMDLVYRCYVGCSHQ